MEIKKEELILEPRSNYSYEPDPKIFYDVIIVGGGVVGFSSAMYASRLGLKTLIIGSAMGGTLVVAGAIENWPGIVSVPGIKLAKLVENHAKDYEIDILKAKANKVAIHKRDGGKHFKIYTEKGLFYGKTVIFATGTEIRKLGVPGEQQFNGKGVSYCALCDGPLFKNKVVGIVGGSDSSIKETLVLSKYVKKVFVIYRGDKVHPEPINMKILEVEIKKGKVEIINNTNITKIMGDKIMESVILDKPYKDSNELKLEGLFVYIGHLPLSKLAEQIKVKLNKKQEIMINRFSETNVKGIYAAGDVADNPFKQAITGAAEGVTAAYHAYEYVNKGEFILPCGDNCE